MKKVRNILGYLMFCISCFIIFVSLKYGSILLFFLGIALFIISLGLLYFRLVNKDIKTSDKIVESNKFFDVDWIWDFACENYCNQHDKDIEEIDDEDEKVIWKYACVEASYLVAWLLENDFWINDDIFIDSIRMVKNKEASPDLLIESLDGKITKQNIKEELWTFVNHYFDIDNTFNEFAQKKLQKQLNNSECYSFSFEWKDYQMFKDFIEESYKNFNINKY